MNHMKNFSTNWHVLLKKRVGLPLSENSVGYYEIVILSTKVHDIMLELIIINQFCA
jgi:hypothetical protein